MSDNKYIKEFPPDEFPRRRPRIPFDDGPFGPGTPFDPGGPSLGRPPIDRPRQFPGSPNRRPDGPPIGTPGRGPNIPPSGPPPSFGPELSPYRVDRGSLRYCLYNYTRIRLKNRRTFWFYPVYLSRTTVAGYRWINLFNRWIYTGIDLDSIRSFSC